MKFNKIIFVLFISFCSNTIFSQDCGIGIKYKYDENAKKIIIQDVIKGSPADIYGLKSNDIIEEIDGEELKGSSDLSIDKFISYISSGKSGTSVTIKISRNIQSGNFKSKTIKQTIEYEIPRLKKKILDMMYYAWFASKADSILINSKNLAEIDSSLSLYENIYIRIPNYEPVVFNLGYINYEIKNLVKAKYYFSRYIKISTNTEKRTYADSILNIINNEIEMRPANKNNMSDWIFYFWAKEGKCYISVNSIKQVSNGFTFKKLFKFYDEEITFAEMKIFINTKLKKYGAIEVMSFTKEREMKLYENKDEMIDDNLEEIGTNNDYEVLYNFFKMISL